MRQDSDRSSGRVGEASRAAVANEVEAVVGATLAIRNSTFELPLGAVTAVIGPNGSGKSTLLNMLAGLVRPSGGSLEVLGTVPSGTTRGVSYVLQATHVNDTFPISVREAVTMGRFPNRGLMKRLDAVDRTAVETAMEAVGVSDLARRSIHELSAGQRQRVMVAQGLAQDHQLLLLDEPMVGLDLVSNAAIERAVAEERSIGKTVVFTTHDVSQALTADWAVLMAGEVIASGPPVEALSAENLALAYGIKVVQAADGRFVVDDPAHSPATGRHVHLDRSIHLEAPGSQLHRNESEPRN